MEVFTISVDRMVREIERRGKASNKLTSFYGSGVLSCAWKQMCDPPDGGVFEVKVLRTFDEERRVSIGQLNDIHQYAEYEVTYAVGVSAAQSFGGESHEHFIAVGRACRTELETCSATVAAKRLRGTIKTRMMAVIV